MAAPSQLRLVTVTFPSEETARAVARQVVATRLAACVNVLPGVLSVYRWEGEICEDREVLAAIKTTADRVPELLAAVKAAHPYDLPAVEVVAVETAGEGVEAWVREATGG
ncbi:divalent-cation tolerance protein CutA [Chthonobacter rhizosphaerae]|uniref:divalent-cation tolerance protein CutA n=1 Tax=Chthonobacter rhizosphaerae TaxID=2735553 RepID=UPI0015EFDC16|nr:divalent-cation tolerance protein CutA [Chthonobacter rhizosphaerae]